MSTLTAEQEPDLNQVIKNLNSLCVSHRHLAPTAARAVTWFTILTAERDALQAKLDALAKQEPTAYRWEEFSGIAGSPITRYHEDCPQGELYPNVEKLYSQPVPASPEIAKVELNMGDMLASCDLMAPVPADSEGEGK